jgi:hypothetical protein
MKTKTVWIVGGVAGALIILYLVFRSMSQTAAAAAANSPGVGASPSTLDSLLGIGDTLGIGSLLSSAGSSVGSIFSGSDNFGDTGTTANDPGLGDDEDDDGGDYSNDPGLDSGYLD